MPISGPHRSVGVPGHRSTRIARSRVAGALVIGFLLVPLLAGPVAGRGPAAPGADPTAAAPDVVPDSWIVQLRPGASAATQAPALARLAGGRPGLVFQLALNGFQFHGSAAAAQALSRLPQVASVVPDREMHLVESLPNGIERIWAFDNDAPADSAYHQGFRGNGARIAILDTGMDLDHPDLAGAIDQSLGKNCVNPALPPEDGYGHGSHVAGTAAAPLNGVGVVGVAPEARLVPVKVFDDAGNSSEALVLCGFNHVLALNADSDPSNDVDVMSMSFGEQRSWGDCVTDPLHQAVCQAYAAGIVMVAGSGNSAVDAGSFVPAAFPEVISVSALADFDAARGGLAGCGFVPDLGWFDCDDTLAFFSNFGASVDVMAPGVSIFSTTKNGGYATQSGTSMATPHVSGVVALMAAVNPGLTPAGAAAFLRQSGECPDGSVAGVDGTCGGQGTWADDPDGTPEPLANALRAAVAAGGTPPAPTVPAAPTLTSATAGNGSVALAWTTPFDGNSSLTGYEVWRSETSGAEVLLTPVPVQTTFTDFTVVNGTTYYYQVRATNAVGPGPLSNELSATPTAPPAPTVPAAPTLTSATAGNGSVALAWTTPFDGNSSLTGYEVWRAETSGAEMLLTPVPVQTTFTDFTVVNGTPYYYQVRATNAVGPGPLSNELSATPTAPPPMVTRTGGTASNFGSASSNAGSITFSLPPGSNALVAMVSLNSTSVTVTSMTWKPDPANPGADQPLTFVGRRTAPAGGAVEIWARLNPTPGQPGSAVAHTLSGNAKRVMGVHALAGVATIGTPVGAGVNANSIAVSVPSVSGGLVLDVVYGQNSTTAYTAGAGQTERWDTNTTGGLNNLRGAGSEETGASSVTMSWTANAGTNMALLAVDFGPTPPAPTVPAAPTLTSATAGNGSVALAWTTPFDGNSSLTGYEVWRSETSGAEVLLTPVPVQTTFTDFTVVNGTTYYYQVRATNAVGPGPLSNELSATPTAPPAPTVPAAPTLTSATAGNGSVALAWTTPFDGNSSLTGYEVWRAETSGAEMLLTPVPVQTTFTDFTVVNGTPYYYQVRATNAVGPGPLSNELSATPTAPPPMVTRTGGTASNFGSASSNAGSITFSLPPGSNALVAMVSLNSTSVTVTSMTWKPDPANPGADQPLTFVGRRTAPAGGAVEIWARLNPTPGQPGSAVAHTLSGNAKRVMGVHALAGVATIGTPVGAGVNANSIAVSVPSVSGGLVLDVVYGQNSTTAYTAGAGQTERWDTNTTGGLNNLRGAGSEETGASSVTMSWTANKQTRMALLGVSFNPSGP